MPAAAPCCTDAAGIELHQRLSENWALKKPSRLRSLAYPCNNALRAALRPPGAGVRGAAAGGPQALAAVRARADGVLSPHGQGAGLGLGAAVREAVRADLRGRVPGDQV